MKMIIKRTIYQLVTDYTQYCWIAQELLQRKAKNLIPHSLYFRGRFPKEGILDKENKIAYSFHGVGCTVMFNQIEVSFDYGENGLFPIFNEWHLNRFLETCPGRYSGLVGYEIKVADMDRLVSKKILTVVGDENYYTLS